jgi:hypothetical protein
MWGTVQYVVCYSLYVFCFLLCSNYSFYGFNFSFYIWFIFCRSRVLFLLTYINVSFLFVYKFTNNCHRLEIQLQLINTISHHTALHLCDVGTSNDNGGS